VKTLTLFLIALPILADVKIVPADGRLDVNIGGKPFTSFYYGPKTTKPYLHPLRAASGKIVTRLYPMESVEGESRDHPHHRGVWFTHGIVNGLDFWMNEPGYEKPHGLIVLDKLIATKSGKTQGSIEASFKWLDPAGKQLLEEHRTMVFYDEPVNRVTDFDVTFTARETITFGDTKEGFFAIRLADALSEKKGGEMTNAEGAKGMKNIWGKPSPWVDYDGELQGEKLGVAIFDHPGNPRHPTTWHARDYGLFATNIFGLHDFMNDKSKDASLTLKPGEKIRFRYRVVIHPGNVETAHIAQLYADYIK